MPFKKIALAAVIATIIILYFVGGGEKYLSVRMYQDLFTQAPIATTAVFFIVFFVGISCSLPVAGVLSVASGVLFGTIIGFSISLAALTLGGTIAFLSTRYLFHDLIQRRFSTQVELVNKGIEKEGGFYLFGLRMVPVIPFWSLNLLVGLTAMRVSTFMFATFCGMIPVLLILTYTGSQLGDIETFSMSAIITPGLVFSLLLLASFPFIAKAIVAIVRKRTNRNNTP